MLSAAAIAAIVWCYPRAQTGAPFASFGLLLAGVVALVSCVNCLLALFRLSDRRRRHVNLKRYKDAQGEARMGDHRDAERFGLLEEQGLLFGRLGKKWLRYDGEKAVLVAGPPGSWKGVAFVILNLLLAPRPSKDHFHSYIVTDISGELYACCARRLRELGYRVLVIASEAERLSRELGIRIDAVRHNPAAYLDAESGEVLADVETFVNLLSPGVEPNKQTGNTLHFEDLGRQVLTFLVLWVLDRYGEVTLPGLRRCVMSVSDEMQGMLEWACESKAFGGALAEAAASVLGMMVASPEEYSGAITTATRAVKLFTAGSPIGRQVSGDDFRWPELKEQPTVVFVMVPPERIKSQAQFINLTISASAEALARCRSHRRVVYLLDEVGNLYLPNLAEVIAVYRKFGLQVVLVLQSLQSQLAKVYGKDGAAQIRDNCAIKMTMSMTGLEDLKELSELIGQETVGDGTHTLSEAAEGDPQVSYTGSYRGRAVLRPEAIRTLPANQALVLYGNAPPFVVSLVNYLQDATLRKLADENPYYRKG